MNPDMNPEINPEPDDLQVPDDSLSAIVYAAIRDEIADRLDDVDMDDLLRDVVRGILEDRSEGIAASLMKSVNKN